MKRSALLLLFTLVLCVSLTNAVTEEIPSSDGERELLTAAERRERKRRKRAEKKAARKAEKQRLKDLKKNRPAPGPAPGPVPGPPPGPPPGPTEPEYDIVYMERNCKGFLKQVDNVTQISIGDSVSFNCQLYQRAIRFGSPGARLIGKTVWNCQIITIYNVLDFFRFIETALWDCTIIDIVDKFDDLKIEDAYIRSQGITTGISNFDTQTGVVWRQFHSHTGNFAVTGGTQGSKGIRGQLEVVYDDYSNSWFHVYYVI